MAKHTQNRRAETPAHFYLQSEVSTPVMCSDVVVYPYQIYQARLAGADALKLLAPALPSKVCFKAAAPCEMFCVLRLIGVSA